MRRWANHLVALLAWSSVACGGDAADTVTQEAAAVACPAGQQRACACLGGTALGVQVCLPSGEGFGTCEGCPTLDTTGGQPAVVPASGGSLSGGVPATQTGGLAASGGTPASGGGGDAPVASGSVTDTTGGALASGGEQASGGAPLETGGAEVAEESGGAPAVTGGTLLDLAPSEGAPGTACGVALPLLCAPDAEKCCMRSLLPDSCMAAADSCTCGLLGCTTTEAYCDGPEDCPAGQVCCGTAGRTGYAAFRCQDSCDNPRTERMACHADAEDSPCPTGLICAISQILSTVQICIDPVTIQQ